MQFLKQRKGADLLTYDDRDLMVEVETEGDLTKLSGQLTEYFGDQQDLEKI